jgi:2-polyprenyl-3-methyl-5-hydroxy-6-metoxy-1,4-benzoquinol methylase
LKVAFDYSSIPPGYYDEVSKSGGKLRRHWHWAKFSRIIDLLAADHAHHESILDVGCAAGTFLGLLPESMFAYQLGIDIEAGQVNYATQNYGTPFRQFEALNVNTLEKSFDIITLIEVVEHLSREDIATLFLRLWACLKPGGHLVLSTPNYASLWPLLEVGVNLVSEITYMDQHISKFTYFGIQSKLEKIVPGFSDRFEIRYKTTSHFLSPYIALFSPRLARKISKAISPRFWRFPFGSIVILVLMRKEV